MPRAGGPAGGIPQRSGILTAGSREQGGNGTAAGEAAEIPREKEGDMRGKSGLICAILALGAMAGARGEGGGVAVLRPPASGESMKIKSVAEEGKTLLLSCAAAEVIVNPVAMYVFKTPQSDKDAVIKIFQQMKKMKISRMGVLSSNTGFGNAGKAQIEKLAPAYRILILANEVYEKAASNHRAEVTKIKAANVWAILNWSIEPAQAIAIKNARQIGFKGPIFQGHGVGNIKK